MPPPWINRAPFNALVDDDGSNTVGTIWGKQDIDDVILTPVEAALQAVAGALAVTPWTNLPYDVANFTASAGAIWSVPGGSLVTLAYTLIGGNVIVAFNIGGPMTISGTPPVRLLIALPGVPPPSRALYASFPYYYSGATPPTGTGATEITPGLSQLNLIRDIGGTPWPLGTSATGIMGGTFIYPYV
jgi:hypothetical protein